MGSWAVDVEFGLLTRCGDTVRAEMGAAEGALTFAQLFGGADAETRDRLLTALHTAVLVTGAFEQTVVVGGRPYRVSGCVDRARPGVVEGSCEALEASV
jgi:hypothetical protein